MAFGRYLRYLKHQPVRESAKAGLATSAVLPNSGIAFAQNSQRASAALVELTQNLDEALEQFDFGNEPNDQVQLQLQRLGQEASKYGNSELAEDTGSEWRCTSSEAKLIAAANVCSAVVYDPEKQPTVSGMEFKRLAYLNPSKVRLAKATGIWEVKQIGTDNRDGSVLIIATRGTSGVLDTMVNLNGEKKDTGVLFDRQTLPIEEGTEPLQGHAGFISSAEAILPVLSKHLEDPIRGSSGIKHILFTGHSAGGAVASLLFAHLLSKSTPEYKSIRFSLITFGAAPVTNIDLTPSLLRLQKERINPGLTLAIVNELDTVVRADRSYLLSLIQLYHSATCAPQNGVVAIQDSNIDCTHLESLKPSLLPNVVALKPLWPIPLPEYHLIGEIIILKTVLAADIHDALEASSSFALKVIKITSDELAELIFWSTEVHSRVYYAKRVSMILEGVFNGYTDWEDE